MTDRTEFEKARQIGLERRHEQRLENATYTAVEVKALTKTAADLAYALGRKEVAEEIAEAIDEHAAANEGREFRLGLGVARRIAREIGTKEAS